MKTSKYFHYARAIWSAAIMAFLQNVFDLFIVFTVLVQPLIIASLALWMVQDRASEAIVFIVVGSGMTGLWSSLLYISGNSITWERWTGTLEMIAGTPTPMSVVVFGKNLAHVSQSLGSMIVAYLLVALIFGYEVHISRPFLFFVSLGLTVIAFVCFGLIMSPLFLLNPGVQRWQNALEYPIYILSGFLFPIALLPGWTTPLSYLLAPYWAARALHGSSSGAATTAEILFSLAMLLVFSSLYLLIAARLFRIMMRKVREEATLGLQ
ncbi:MAG: ABC transporter permease [Anaerolineales bacterium]|nr:ABC transporter permease [Anaerolineales bacterium]